MEEKFYRQKSRMNWLNLGDSNSSYFHSAVKARTNQNSIQGTTTYGGDISTDPGEIAKTMSSYFQDLLNRSDNSSSRDPDLIPDPIRKLSSTVASLLTKDFSSEEIWQVIKDSDGNKAPGPNGYNGDFFKSFWYLIGSEITVAIQSFFLKGKILPKLNTTFISLIPKHPDACSPENYRPISLCNFLYKVITKLLANRLKPIMNQLISPFQSSFISDEVMIYADPNPPNASGILLCLRTFKLCSGLEVNPTKSEIFFAGVENCTKRAICNILHIREGNLPIKYLGLPLVTSRLNSRDCQPIIDKVRKKISTWTNRHLSRSGRIELVRSILSTYQIYWSGSFHIPAEVLLDIEKIFRNFIWSGPSLEKKYHHISRDIICKPKKEGGLGIRCLKDLNIAGQIKQLWNVVSGDKSLWVLWFHRKYIRNRSFWNISMPGNPSWVVRGIFRVRDIARKHICYIVGPNSNLLFCKDPWHPNGPLENQSSLSSISIPESTTISDTISNGWWSLIHQHPYLSDLKAIIFTSLFSSSTPSVPVWMPEAYGTFFTKSAWNSIPSSHHPPDWVSSLWFPGHIPKFSFTAWQAIQDRLPTKDRLTFLPINADKRCLLCNSPGSGDQFSGYYPSGKIRENRLEKRRVGSGKNSNSKDSVVVLQESSSLLLFTASDLNNVNSRIAQIWNLPLFHSQSESRFCQWVLPSQTELKINTDASISSDMVSLGGILRDSKGQIISLFSVAYDSVPIQEAELEAIIRGVQLARNSQVENLWI
ncbi:uncharacterized protein LOC143882467 [Tasmannia lanceolata]|uniref:uncharacterized protein LOC143882467 n=1 Tax=Tasmannia lanceolata TaxID=3420 RepID=UPI004062FA31